jgi:DNA-binding NarL/FixJ family response regulator
MPLQSRRLRRELPDAVHHHDKVESLIYVDDRALTRDCVAGQLTEWLPEFSVTAVAGYDEVGEPSLHESDSCILYNTHALRIEEIGFLRNLPAMRQARSGLRVAVLSDLESRENIIAALRLGVRGYLLTSLSLKIAAEIIRLIHAGGTFIPSSAVLDAEKPELPEGTTAGTAPRLRGFTRRQVEVLRQLREGKQNKAIAYELNMSESTVKVHLHHIMQKLQATNRMQVILRTRELFEGRRPAGLESPADAHRTNGDAALALWPTASTF